VKTLDEAIEMFSLRGEGVPDKNKIAEAIDDIYGKNRSLVEEIIGSESVRHLVELMIAVSIEKLTEWDGSGNGELAEHLESILRSSAITGFVNGVMIGIQMERQEVSEPSITCPRCGKTSHNANDVEQRYCGNCHQFHETAL
jgi:hypothetical protein